MDRESFERLRDWVEPAHPMIVERYEDIVEIYRFVREKYQPAVDELFDKISRQIGYIVASTVPVMLEFGEGGVLNSVQVGADHLRGTLFEQVVQVLKPREKFSVRAGKYNIYLIWYDALKLRLRKDWVEPAHFRRDVLLERAQRAQSGAEIKWDVREPAHWFDPGTRMVLDDAIQISVLDEVYPELRLAERVAFYRYAYLQQVRPEVMEPAHFRKPEVDQLLQQLRRLLEG